MFGREFNIPKFAAGTAPDVEEDTLVVPGNTMFATFAMPGARGEGSRRVSFSVPSRNLEVRRALLQ